VILFAFLLNDLMFQNRPFLGSIKDGKVGYQTYYAIQRRVRFIGSGILMNNREITKIGLFATTSAECVIVAEAANMYNLTLVCRKWGTSF
jgi:long-subunit acyl-CoA synthetase (AMP-forming)